METSGRGRVQDEGQRQTRQGPITLLLLLVGLVLGSAGGAGFGFETERSSSELRQTRTAKASLALRAAPRDTAADEEDKARDPLLAPPPVRIATRTTAEHPAAAVRFADFILPRRTDRLAYQARAPPAA